MVCRGYPSVSFCTPRPRRSTRARITSTSARRSTTSATTQPSPARRSLSAVGRFDSKYPPEAIAELYRLHLDVDPPLSVPKALAEIARTHGVDIVESTAYSY